jgi:hypothetical protein
MRETDTHTTPTHTQKRRKGEERGSSDSARSGESGETGNCGFIANESPSFQWPLDSGAEARQVVEVQAGEEATSEPQCGEAAFCPTYSTISAWSSHWSAHQLHIYKAGKVSAYFGKMEEGDYLSARGPKGRFMYKPNQVWAFGMLAGGLALLPCTRYAALHTNLLSYIPSSNRA